MFKAYMFAGIAASAMLAASSAFAGNLIQDGSFSNPNMGGGWGIVANGFMGWTTNDPYGLEIGASGIYGLPCDNGGCQNQEIDSYEFDTVSYTVTGLTVGKTYDLSWDYGGRTGGGPDFLNVSFGGNALVQDSRSVGVWTHNAFAVLAAASSETLTFAAVDTSGLGGLPSYGNEITNVNLAAPEASTWAMMLAGFAGLGFVGLRGSRQAVALSL
jgi:hypothetical protein